MFQFIKKPEAAAWFLLLALTTIFACVLLAQQLPTTAPAAAVANRPKILSVDVTTNGNVHLQISGQAG